jgi:mono/diheme cytochrome c family protein
MRILNMLLLAGVAFAQGDSETGAKVFRQTCSIGYCHGAGGGAGRAPVLAGRGLAHTYLAKVVAEGIPGTGMPGFRSRLSGSDYNAVMAYLLKINGTAASGPIFEPVKDAPASALPASVQKGKDLFFDAIRGTRCGTCHAVEAWGQAVGPNPVSTTVNVAELRNGKGTQVQTARLANGETFPAVLVESKAGRTRLFDLTTPPPVARSFASKDVKLGGAANWKHADQVKSYSDADLSSIVEYLKWLAQN